jgi:hypothetical protein
MCLPTEEHLRFGPTPVICYPSSWLFMSAFPPSSGLFSENFSEYAVTCFHNLRPHPTLSLLAILFLGVF